LQFATDVLSDLRSSSIATRTASWPSNQGFPVPCDWNTKPDWIYFLNPLELPSLSCLIQHPNVLVRLRSTPAPTALGRKRFSVAPSPMRANLQHSDYVNALFSRLLRIGHC
jgi:hypothetical protein